MAVYCRGMTEQETTALTRAMLESGRVLQWGAGGPVCDKHSTGGVGDKVSLVLAPLLVASAVGQARAARAERWGALSEVRAAAGAEWPGPGETLYVMPSELVPFFRSGFDGIELRRVERLPCAEGGGGSAAVLDVNPWRVLDRPRDHLMRAALTRYGLAEDTRAVGFPPENPTYTFYRASGLDGALLGELCRRGVTPPLWERMAGSVSEALPGEQLAGDEWSFLEVSPELELYRWATAAEVTVRFDRPLPAGRYELHLVGARLPRSSAAFGFELKGGGWSAERTVPAGRFHLCFEVGWDGGGGAPLLGVEHPVWSHPGDGSDPAPGDERSLSFLLYGAWFAASDEPGPGDCSAGSDRLPTGAAGAPRPGLRGGGAARGAGAGPGARPPRGSAATRRRSTAGPRRGW